MPNITPNMILDTAAWCQSEDELRDTLRQAAEALSAALAAVEPEPVASEQADLFTARQAAYRRGVDFACNYLNTPDDDYTALWKFVPKAAYDYADKETVYAAPPPAIPAWQDISTAPTDGTSILAAHEHAVFTVYWTDDRDTDTNEPGWVDGSSNRYEEYTTYQPTHWMPLPPAPSATEASK